MIPTAMKTLMVSYFCMCVSVLIQTGPMKNTAGNRMALICKSWLDIIMFT